MQMVKYDPFRDFQRMDHDLNKLWKKGWNMFPSFTDATTMDLYEEGGNLIAEVSLPNFKKNEVKVTTEEGVLEISAEHKEEQEKKDKRRYYFRESSNQFFRRVSLPSGVDANKADASFKDGILKISMPVSTSKKAHDISVK